MHKTLNGRVTALETKQQAAQPAAPTVADDPHGIADICKLFMQDWLQFFGGRVIVGDSCAASDRAQVQEIADWVNTEIEAFPAGGFFMPMTQGQMRQALDALLSHAILVKPIREGNQKIGEIIGHRLGLGYMQENYPDFWPSPHRALVPILSKAIEIVNAQIDKPIPLETNAILCLLDCCIDHEENT